MQAFKPMDEDPNNELELELLSKIDIPFFHNNLDYINVWKRYYQTKKDISILLLMKFKKISNDYHWLHIELARFFKKKGKEEVSVYVLRKAIENKVYDSSLIIDELKNYDGVEMASEAEAHRYLFPKGFKVLDKQWNAFINCLYCNEDILKSNDKFISLEEYRFNMTKDKIKEQRECILKIEDRSEDTSKIQVIKSSQSTDTNKEIKNWAINESNKEVKLITFLETTKTLKPRDQGIILEYCLLLILDFIDKNRDTPKFIDLDVCNITIDLNLKCQFKDHRSLDSTLFEEIYLFFDQLSTVKILTKDCIKTFDDLVDKISKLEAKFALKENIHIINKQKITLAEMIFHN